MHEAEELCDRVTIIDKGHVKICDTIPKIKAKMNGSTKYALILNMAYEQVQQHLSSQLLKNESITLLSIQPVLQFFQFEPTNHPKSYPIIFRAAKPRFVTSITI